MEALIRRRTVVTSALSRFSNFVNGIEVNNIPIVFKLRSDDAKSLINKFDNIQNQIEEVFLLAT